MSDLPSRDAVDEALTFAPLTDAAADPIYDIARAYVHGGRLVDRDTIDYEAADDVLEEFLQAEGSYMTHRDMLHAAIAVALRIGDTE